jgi:hypothetical protein
MHLIRFTPVLRRLRPLTGISLLILASVGCSGRGDVSGKVTYKGKPLVFGTVLIQGSDGSSQQGNIEKDGSFTVRGVAPGVARVAVNSPNPRNITLVVKDPSKKREGYPDAPGWFDIPKKYENVESSGLKYTIKGGSNTIDIEMN